MQGISCQHANLIRHLETDNLGKAPGSQNIIYLKERKPSTRRLLQLWNKLCVNRRTLQQIFRLEGCTTRPLSQCAFHYSTFYLSSGERGVDCCESMACTPFSSHSPEMQLFTSISYYISFCVTLEKVTNCPS